jgi:PKD repeat protein
MVIKKFLIVLASIIVLTAVFVMVADASISNGLSIRKIYTSGQLMEASFNLSLSNFPVDSMVTLNILNPSQPVQQMPLKEFLRLNNITYTCSPSNCLGYFTSSNASPAKTVNGEKYIGIAITDKVDNVAIKDLTFDMQGSGNTKPACGSSPLIVDLLDDQFADWKYLDFGDGVCGTSRPSDAYDKDNAGYKCTIKSDPYCEKIMLPMASKFILSADIKSGLKDVFIKISIGNHGFNGNSVCELNISNLNGGSGILSCDTEFMSLDEKEYDICIKTETGEDSADSSDHDLKCESNDPSSGFTSAGPSNFDFGLYAQPADFAPFTDTDIETFGNSTFFGPAESLSKYLQSYIETQYNKKCNSTKPCVIPIKVSSTQDINFSNVDLAYSSGGINLHVSSFSEAEKEPALITASGKVKLENSDFFRVPIKYGRYDYELKIGNEVIDSGNSFLVQKLPEIKLSPTNFSAGVSTRFSVVTDNASSYYWDFGDGSTIRTFMPYADHTYAQLGEYTLAITVIINNNNYTKRFTVDAYSPKDLVNRTIHQKASYLAKMESDMNALAWYKSLADEQINLADMRTSISAFQTQSSQLEADFVSIMTSLNNFIVFKGIKSEDIGLAPLAQSVDIDLLSKAGAGSISDRTKLEEEITNWQGNLDIKAKGTVKIAESEIPAGNIDLLTVMTVEINPLNSLGKVFVIIRNTEGAKFPDNGSSIIDGSRLFVFDSIADKKSIQFALPGRINPADIEIISSPAFSEFVVGEYYCGNGICEKDKGESFETCPEDCKRPIFTLNRIIYAIIILIVVLGILYWIWRYYVYIYEKRLEEKLFRNKADLYNLTYFIGRAMNKNEKEEDIRKKLIEAKWNPEQVDYALAKIKKERKKVQFNTLKNFITNELRQSKQEEVIKKELKDAGWNEADINDAYKKTLKDIENGKKSVIQKSSVAIAAASSAPIKKRNIFLVYLFSIITFGIYAIYWFVVTRNEINKFGAQIPTPWLLIVPIANLYWLYKYAEGFSAKVKGDNNTILWALLFIFVGIITPGIVQSELNKHAQ